MEPGSARAAVCMGLGNAGHAAACCSPLGWQGGMWAGRDAGREGCGQQGAGLTWLGTGLGVLAMGNGVTHYWDVPVNAGSLWSDSLSPAQPHRTGVGSSPQVPPRAAGWLWSCSPMQPVHDAPSPPSHAEPPAPALTPSPRPPQGP